MAWHRHAHLRDWPLAVTVPGAEVHQRTTFGVSARFEARPDMTPTGKAVAEVEIVVPEFPDQEDPVSFDVHHFHFTAAQALEVGSVLVRVGEACLPGGSLEELDLTRSADRREAVLSDIEQMLSLAGPTIQMMSADTRRTLEWLRGRLVGEGVAAPDAISEGVAVRRALRLPDDEPIEHVVDIVAGLSTGGLVSPSRVEAVREINEALYWLEDVEHSGAVSHLKMALEFLGATPEAKNGKGKDDA